MKTRYLGSFVASLALAASVNAQTINNGQEVGGVFQMDISIPAGAGPGWFLQQTPVLPTVPAAWVTIAGPFAPGPTFPILDPGSVGAFQRYYRLVRAVPPLVATDCGVNRYGFIRKTVGVGWSMIADHLTADLGNTLANIMPVMPDQTVFYQYSILGWAIDTWQIAFSAWDFGTSTLNPGQGCFLLNPGPVTTVTFIGQVQEGLLITPLAAGYNMVSSQVPQAGLLSTDLGYVPSAYDRVYKYNAGYVIFVYDPDLGGWDPSEPFIDVGESFFLYRDIPGSWNRVFNACP